MVNRWRALVLGAAFVLLSPLVARPAQASTLADIGSPIFDPPTQASLGVRLPVPEDLNANASVAVRYRATGTADWHEGPPLHRVHAATWPSPDITVWPHDISVPAQFAGSILGLRPGTSYDIDLTVSDGAGATTIVHTSTTTSPMPEYPQTPHTVPVSTGPQLQHELDVAVPGTVIQLESGDYSVAGNFHIGSGQDGSPDDPVLVIAAPHANPRLIGTDGMAGAPVLTISANYVHVYGLTIEHGQRGILVADHVGAGGTLTPNEGAVIQRVTISDVRYGIATGNRYGMHDAYICDNDLTGQFEEGWFNGDGNGSNDWDGIMVGSGSMVCHNTIRGFGDAMIVYNNSSADEPRGIDFVGNDVRWTYDNGIEADHSYSNVRIYRNRFLNNFAPLSFQPVFGGPSYVFRNVVVNAKSDVFKLHGDGPHTEGPAGVMAYHNTVVTAGVPLVVNSIAKSTDFAFEDNLFVGSATSDSVNWFAPVDAGSATFDYNGYQPDSYYWFGFHDSHPYKYYKLDPVDGHDGDGAVTSVHTGGLFEANGRAVGSDVFTNLTAWPGWTTAATATVSAALSPTTVARDAGRPLPGINDVPDGKPDLGALEFECAAPAYGVRTLFPDDAEGPEPNSPSTGPGADDPCATPAPPSQPVSWQQLHYATSSGSTLQSAGGGVNTPGNGISGMLVKDSAKSTWENAVDFTWPQASAQGCVGLVPSLAPPGTCPDMRYRLQFTPDGGSVAVSAMDGDQQLGTVHAATTSRLAIAVVNGQVWFGADGRRFAVTPFALTAVVAPGAVLLTPDAAVADANLSRITNLALS
jgi:hypothetical protein